jgi:hypothetical protein
MKDYENGWVYGKHIKEVKCLTGGRESLKKTRLYGRHIRRWMGNTEMECK